MNACRLWLGIVGVLLLQGQILIGAAAPVKDQRLQAAYEKAKKAERFLREEILLGTKISDLNSYNFENDPLNSNIQTHQAVDKALTTYGQLQSLPGWDKSKSLYTVQELTAMQGTRKRLRDILARQEGRKEEGLKEEAEEKEEEEQAPASAAGQAEVELKHAAEEEAEEDAEPESKYAAAEGVELYIQNLKREADGLQDMDIATLNQFKEKLRALQEADWRGRGGTVKPRTIKKIWIDETLPVVRNRLADLVEETYHIKVKREPIADQEYQQLMPALETSLSQRSPELKQAYDKNDTGKINSILTTLSWHSRLEVLKTVKNMLSVLWRYVIYVRDLPDKRAFLEQIQKGLGILVDRSQVSFYITVSNKYRQELPLPIDIKNLDIYKQMDMYSDLQTIVIIASILGELGKPFIVPLQFPEAHRPATIDEVKRVVDELSGIIIPYITKIGSTYQFVKLKAIDPEGLYAQVHAITQRLSSIRLYSVGDVIRVGENIDQFEEKIKLQSEQVLKQIENTLIEGLRLSLYGWNQRFDELYYGKLVIWFDEALKITQNLLGENAQQIRAQPAAQPQLPSSAISSSSAQPHLPSRSAGAAGAGEESAASGSSASLTGLGPAGRPLQPQAPDDGGGAAPRPTQADAPIDLPPLTHLPPPLQSRPSAPRVAQTPQDTAGKIEEILGKLKKIVREKNDIVLQRGADNITDRTKELEELQKRRQGLKEDLAKLIKEEKNINDFIERAQGIVRLSSGINARFNILKGRVENVTKNLPLSTWERAWNWVKSWFTWPWNRNRS